jgi:hypothetical protein
MLFYTKVALTFFPGGMLQQGVTELQMADPDEESFEVKLGVGAERILQTRLHEDVVQVKPNHQHEVKACGNILTG